MKKQIIQMLAAVILLSGCANFLCTTGNRGIAYGMNPEVVIKVNEKKGYKILNENENSVVVEGLQEQLNQPAEKTFYFENGHLVSVSEKIK